jgi:hypothetical protein
VASQGILLDRRGVAAMEFAILGLFIVALLLPISDVAAAALTYMRTYQAIRNVAALVQYNPPPDITQAGTWPNLPSESGYMTGYDLSAHDTIVTPPQSTPGSTIAIYVTVRCGDPPGARCTNADVSSPTTAKWYYLNANVKLNPMYITSLTGGELSYSQRFQ